MKAKCLCGNVSLEVEHDKHVHACHCGMCRTWGSCATFSLIAAKPPKIDGEANITRYHSSEWAERAFCKNCGTHLFYHFLPNDSYFVFAGLFADFHRSQSPVLRTGKRHAQADRRRIFGTIRRRIKCCEQKPSENWIRFNLLPRAALL